MRKIIGSIIILLFFAANTFAVMVEFGASSFSGISLATVSFAPETSGTLIKTGIGSGWNDLSSSKTALTNFNLGFGLQEKVSSTASYIMLNSLFMTGTTLGVNTNGVILMPVIGFKSVLNKDENLYIDLFFAPFSYTSQSLSSGGTSITVTSWKILSDFGIGFSIPLEFQLVSTKQQTIEQKYKANPASSSKTIRLNPPDEADAK